MKKKKVQEALLFPGYLLNEKIDTIQYGAGVCGLIFELISSRVLKASHLQTDPTEELCPDLGNEDSLFESKCFGVKSHRDSRCLVHIQQLQRYLEITEKGVHYVFWQYDKGFQLDKNTKIGTLVETCSSNIGFGLVLDVQIVRQMVLYINQIVGIRYRHVKLYFVGREIIYRDYLVISRRFFEGLISETAKTLQTLGLDHNSYELNSGTRKVTFRYNDVPFQTNRFPLHRILQKVPF